MEEQVVCEQVVCGQLRVSKLCVEKLCVEKLCVSKLCVDKLCVDKLCVEDEVEEEAAGGGLEEAGVQNEKQEPHTKMWGNMFLFVFKGLNLLLGSALVL